MAEKDRPYYQYEPLEVSADDEVLRGEGTVSSKDSGKANTTIRSQSLGRSFLPFAAASKDNLAEDVDESNKGISSEEMALLAERGKNKKKKKEKEGFSDDEDDEENGNPAFNDGHETLSSGSQRSGRRRGANTMSAWTTFMYSLGFVLFVSLCYGAIMMTQSLACLGAPYLYVTHQGSRNVMKFSRDGCLLHQKVLWGLQNSLQSNLRSMVFGEYLDKPALYVADSDEEHSGIMVFGTCLESSSLRPFIRRIASSAVTAGSQHTYGISIDKHGDVYASFQKTDAVLRFSAHNDFAPMANEMDLKAMLLKKFKANTTVAQLSKRDRRLRDMTDPATVNDGPDNDQLPTLEKKAPKEDPTLNYVYFPGTFVQFGAPDWHNVTEQGVRSILWVRNYTELWISNEDVNQVVIVDRSGHHIDSVNIHEPVGLYYTASMPSVVFVASKNKKAGGVFAVDLITRQIVKSYIAIGMKHPTGIVSYEDVLFVGDQTRNGVITFNITTGRVIKMIIPSSKIKGAIEQITLSDC